jgi:hypothetical protein
MKYRKLRIAWSVAWGSVCLLMIVFWVRGNSWLDGILVGIKPSTSISISSMPGAFLISLRTDSTLLKSSISHTTTGPIDGEYDEWLRRHYFSPAVIHFYTSRKPIDYFQGIWKVTYWFAAAFPAAIGAMPWLRWRFSLRTLLIGMTLVAVGLGSIVYAVR